MERSETVPPSQLNIFNTKKKKNGDLKDLSQNPPNQLKYVDLSDGVFFMTCDWLLMISNLQV